MQLKNHCVTVILLSFFLFLSCKDDETIPDITYAFGTPPIILEVSASQCIEQGDSLFAMHESFEMLTNVSERSFYVDEPLTVRMKNNKLELRNFMAFNFKDVTVLFTSPYLKDTIKLACYEEIPGFYEIPVDSPFATGEKVYATTSGRPVRINNLSLLTDGQYKLHVVCNDTILNKVRTNKMHTRISMGRYAPPGWAVITPKEARLFCAAMVNYTITLSSDVFAKNLLDYKGCAYDPDPNKTTTDSEGVVHYFDMNGHPSTAQGNVQDDSGQQLDRNLLITRLREKKNLVCGAVTGAAGRGGGDVFGIGQGYCYDCFYNAKGVLKSNYTVSVMTHELGHCTGYGHNSSVAASGYYKMYSSVGEYIIPISYRYLMEHNMLPYIANPFK